MRLKRERYLAAGRCADCGQPRGDSHSIRYCVRCATRQGRKSTSSTRQLRLRVLRAYSGEVLSCACCGERGLPFLTLDHLNNDGRAHRRRLKGWQGVFRELVRNGFPSGYQVLCYNCNLARFAYGICPHQGVLEPGPRPIRPRKAPPVRDETSRGKRCTQCKQALPLADFYPDKGTRIGLQSRCRTCTRDAALERLHVARHEALVHYAAGDVRCACCGERDERFLALDHINGAGPRPPATLRGGNPFYAWLKQQGFPPGLQVLCHSCNCAKRAGPACPHALAGTGDPLALLTRTDPEPGTIQAAIDRSM